MTDEVSVTQADRDAAADLADKLEYELAVGGNDLASIRAGVWDNVASSFGSIVQAFARHRIAAEQSRTPAERTLLTLVDTMREYLPRDGISKEEFINRVLGVLDNDEMAELVGELEGRK